MLRSLHQLRQPLIPKSFGYLVRSISGASVSTSSTSSAAAINGGPCWARVVLSGKSLASKTSWPRASMPGLGAASSVHCRCLSSTSLILERAKRARTARSTGGAPPPKEDDHHNTLSFQNSTTHVPPVSMEERLESSQLKTLEDKPTQKYVAKVFATTTSTIGVAAATSGIVMFSGLAASIPMYTGLIGIVPLVGFYFTDVNTNPTVRHALLASFTGISGLSLAPVLSYAAAMDPTIVPLALGGTALIMAGSSGAALLAPRASMLKFAPILGGSALAMLGLGLFGMAQYSMTGTVSPWLTSLHLYGGLGLAVAFTAFDTQNIIEEYRAGSRDYLRHSLDMFVNFLMIFRRMLALLMQRD